MTQLTPRFRLSDQPDGLGLSCDASGLELAGVPLLRKGAQGFAPRSAEEIAALLRQAYGEDGPAVAPSGLRTVAEALNRGELAKAMIAAVHLRLPELDADGAVRLILADHALAKYDPDQPRDDHGRWTADGAGGASTDTASNTPALRQPPTGTSHSAGVQAPRTAPTATPAAPSGAKPTHIATAADLAIPATPDAAPRAIQFSPELQSQFDKLWAKSHPTDKHHPNGQAQEWGDTVVTNRQGVLSAQNTVHGEIDHIGPDGKPQGGEVRPNLNVTDPGKYKPIGAPHTHPYTETPDHPAYTGISLSGPDAAYITSTSIGDLHFIMAQSGDAQFMFLKTKETPANLDGDALYEIANARTHRRVDLRLSFQNASRMVAKGLAIQYNLAYYEGEHGALTRVYPK
jgi:hypothetical protein